MLTAAALVVLGALTAGASVYYAAVLVAAIRFRRRREPATDDLPSVSILKAIRGRDENLFENLRTHAAQDYPKFELIFAVSGAADPALGAIRALQEAFPAQPVQVRICRPVESGNPKIAQLEEAEPLARSDLLLINDADIRVGPAYLRRIVGALSGPDVGLVTCLYRARPGRTRASWLDALWISADFPGQALVGEAAFGGLRFALGATMLLRRSDLAAVGGLAAIRPFLADDYQLGTRIAALGRRVVLAGEVVETTLGDASWREAWRRRLRWSRTIRLCRPLGHLGLVWTFGTLWSVLLCGLAGFSSPWTLLAAGCWLLRYGAGTAVAGALQAWRIVPLLPLLPLSDAVAFAIWAASFQSRRVTWGGRRLQPDREGKIP